MKITKKNMLIAALLGMVVNTGCMDEDPRSFKGLPIEMKIEIVHSIVDASISLDDAIQRINNLQVNWEFNEIINDSIVCLKFIQSLSERFKRSNMTVAEKLGTNEAKRRKKLQDEFMGMCSSLNSFMYKTNDFLTLNDFEKIYKQGIDLEFTKSYDVGQKYKYILTPLGVALIYLNEVAVKFLIDHGAHVNNQDVVSKTTPLWIAVLKYRDIEKFWEREKMRRLIQRLLDAGADPELADIDGKTPLKLADETGDQELILLIQDAIAKKHGKK